MTHKMLFLVGSLLVAIAIVWLFTPFSDYVLKAIGLAGNEPQRGPLAGGLLEYLPLALDVLATVFGGIGAYVAIKNRRESVNRAD